MVRPRSGLLTTSIRELVMVCKGGHLRGIGYQADLDQSYYLYAILRITAKPSLFNHFFNTLFPFSPCHKLHSAITLRMLAQFPRSKMRLKALKKTFLMMPKMCQSNQYLLRYQLISAEH